MKKKIEIAVLLVLAVVLGYYGYQRIGIRMGGTPSSFESPYATEEDWMLDNILRDIAETAAQARGVDPQDVQLTFERAPSGPLDLPTVSLAARVGSASWEGTLALDRSFWNSTNYVHFARALLGEPPAAPSASADTLEALLEPRPSVLISENRRISNKLQSDILDVGAHEEATVLLGVLGLKEAAYGFDDKRFLLLRMTAHLAIASALRGDASVSVVGRIGEATLLALTGRQKELLEALGSLESRELTDVEASWVNVLYMYSVEDWRRSAPLDTLLVRLARFRAMVSMLDLSTALDRVVVGSDDALADWGRISVWLGAGGVAGKSFTYEQVGRELNELQEVSLAYHERPIPLLELGDYLNVAPSRLVGKAGVQVLDWGVWAAFYQRHLAGALAARNRLLRETLGMPDEAESFGRDAQSAFDALVFNPVLQVRRSRFVGGRVEDTIGMDAAIALSRRRPELINPTNWLSLEDTAAHMMRKRGMPDSSSWLSPVVLVTGILDSTSHRLDIFQRSIDPRDAVDRMLETAPQHSVVLDELAELLERDEGNNAYEELSSRLGVRIEFDTHAMRDLLKVAEEDDDRIQILGRMCAFDPNECGGLGWAYVTNQAPEKAVAAFERLVKEGTSAIDVCNNANWLVNYYFDNGRREEADSLSEHAADVYCSWGLRTRAYFLERIGRFDKAEELYRADNERYDYDGPVSPALLAFYYRMVKTDARDEYDSFLQRWLPRVFPEGVETLPEEDVGTVAPTNGVLVDGTSKRLDDAGLRGGDVIVGLDGYRVRTLDQYDVILELRPRTSNARDMNLRIWRQTRYIDEKVDDVPGRRFQVRMRTNGTRGPSFLWR